MFKWFIIHQWKSARRSSIWQKNLALNIFIGFLMIVLLSYIVILGVLLDKILLEVVQDKDPENVLSGILIYYFLITFMMRFFLQSIPAIQAVPYLHLPVKRNTLARFLTLKSLTNFFNWIPVLLFLPFTLNWMIPFHGLASSLIWFIGILLFEWTSNFKLIWFKRKNTDKPWLGIVVLLVAVAFYLLDSYEIFSLSAISEWFFMSLLTYPIYILLPLFTMIFWYYYNIKFIKKVIYLEDLVPNQKTDSTVSDSFIKLRQFGILGELVLKEVRLLLRNKRSKTVLFLIPMFLLYGMLFYPQDIYLEKTGWLVFVGIFITGGFLMAYGQYTMAWESAHFDFILTSKTSFYDFFKAKYYLMVIVSVILYFITIPYVYFGVEIFWLNLAALFYNIGVNSLILLYTASYNKKRMDLSKGAMMNYQGVGINNFLMVLPLLIIPMLIYAPIKAIFGYEIAVITLSGIGVVGLIFHTYFIKLSVKHFEKKRYTIAEGYRQKF